MIYLICFMGIVFVVCLMHLYNRIFERLNCVDVLDCELIIHKGRLEVMRKEIVRLDIEVRKMKESISSDKNG